jgi:hypothetical protein
MGKKFTIDEFKLTFKKPAIPKGVSGKDKDQLEDIVKEHVKGDDRNKGQFATTALKIYQQDADYYVDLLSFKLAKHWDSKERKIWLDNSPREAVDRIFDRLYGTKVLDADAINAELENPISVAIPEYLYKTYPELMKAAAKQKFVELSDDELEGYGTKLPMEARKELLLEGFRNSDASAVRACNGMFPFLPLNQQMELAAANPAFFIANVFDPAHRSGDNALTMLKDAKWREILARDPVAWRKLADSMPILSVGEAAKVRVGKDDPTPAEMTNAIFDCVCLNDGIELTYFTNPVDTDHALLGGPAGKDELARSEQIEKLTKQGYEEPEKPATQCHNLKGIVKQIIQLSLGNKVVIEEDHIANMLLTKPLSGMPGGLLPNSFGGNVRDDKGNLTGQVMFTGVGGKQSHTWLRIDGIDFDPVLGTRGREVADSKADEFKWIVPEMVGIGTSGDYIIKDPQLKAAPNKNGFGSCYRLTKKPLDYIQGVYGISFEFLLGEVKVKEVFAGGPANAVLQAGDVVLKVDGHAADPTLLASYNLGADGQKRVFEIRRGKKKKKVSVKAISPLAFG